MSQEITDFDNLNEKTLAVKEIFNGRVIDVVVKDVELIDGSKSKREVVLHNGGCCILPIDNDGNTYLVKQFRSPFERILLELPAGKLEKGEDPQECAVRELREEIGFKCSDVTNLGEMIVSPGYCSEVIHLYMAQGLTFVGQDLDEGEFVNIIKLPFKKLVDMVNDGTIIDGKTCLCVLKAAGRLENGI